MARRSDRMETIVSLSKRRGIVYPSSEIYGGLRASWDYGPLGVEIKNSIKRQWWKSIVTEREDIVGVDSSVILAREVWEASGHVNEFVDPLTECQSCHKRFRADHLIEAYQDKHSVSGSTNSVRWPLASHTSGARITDESRPTMSSRSVTIERHHWRLMLFFISTPSGP